MPDETPDFAAARAFMVDGQVRPNKVSDPRIIGAMRLLPRERFVPRAMAALAYADEDVPLGGGRVLMEPMLAARLFQIAAVRRGERVLVLAAGCGYSAALAAALEAEVVAVESDPSLAAGARALLAELAPGVRLIEGPLAAGCADLAPYDVVLVDGAFEVLPDAVVAQLRRPGGRLVGIRAGDRISQGVIGEAFGQERAGAPLGLTEVFDAATPRLAELRRAPAFVF